MCSAGEKEHVNGFLSPFSRWMCHFIFARRMTKKNNRMKMPNSLHFEPNVLYWRSSTSFFPPEKYEENNTFFSLSAVAVAAAAAVWVVVVLNKMFFVRFVLNRKLHKRICSRLLLLLIEHTQTQTVTNLRNAFADTLYDFNWNYTKLKNTAIYNLQNAVLPLNQKKNIYNKLLYTFDQSIELEVGLKRVFSLQK